MNAGHRRGAPRSDEGSGTVLALAIALVGAALALLVCDLGLAVIARHRATAAADLAALAAAGVEPPSCAVAADLARRNGGRLSGCEVAADGSVTVTVQVPIGVPGLGRPAVGRARAGVPGAGHQLTDDVREHPLGGGGGQRATMRTRWGTRSGPAQDQQRHQQPDGEHDHRSHGRAP
ncbi:MAG: flp pilus-assembly TadE/G-like family protein [Kineosporiaceae bacterium]|nr:flp pilus-assembly TadE/G-like family protein [Kineosporiaceae bacterium]